MFEFSLENGFVILSLLVAICVTVEFTLLKQNGGKLPLGNNLFMIISLITSAWSILSCVAWYFLQFTGLSLVVVIAYPLYSLASFIYSTMLIRDVQVDRPEDLVLPDKYLDFCKSFGVAYALLCLVAIAELAGLVNLPI